MTDLRRFLYIWENSDYPIGIQKNIESRLAYMLEPEHQAAMNAYIDWRIEMKLKITGSDEYRGLKPDSPLFLARGSEEFAFRRKEYVRADGTVADYWVCSSLQYLLSQLVWLVDENGSSHSGRRTFATRLADRGVDLEYIKYFLGHKSKQQSLAYIEANQKRVRNILKNVFGEF